MTPGKLTARVLPLPSFPAAGAWRAKYRDVACKNEHSTSASASLVELRAKSTRAKEQKEHQKSTRAERTEASSGEQKEQSESELGGLAYV